jgi:hypothetical protein
MHECCKEFISMPTNTISMVEKKPTISFIGRISTMGERKLVIYIKVEHQGEILKRFKNRDLKVTLEEAI